MKIGRPLYVIESSQACWRCRSVQQVIALASFSMREDDEDGENDGEEPDFTPPETESGEPFLFSNIEEMPRDLQSWLEQAYPQYRPHFSRTANCNYFANLCECGANFGDFYLHGEPGGAFFPMSPEDCAGMRIRQIPLEGPFDVIGGWSMGTGELIFANARRE